MLKTTIMINELVIESGFSPEEIERISKHKPDALRLCDDDGSVDFVYKVDYSNPILSQHGIVFNRGQANNITGRAVIKVPVYGENTDQMKRYVADEYGSILAKAAKIEDRLENALTNIEVEFNAIIENIDVVL